MSTIEKIKMDAPGVIEKLGRGETITHNERVTLDAYNTLYGKRAGNSGKRKIIKTGR